MPPRGLFARPGDRRTEESPRSGSGGEIHRRSNREPQVKVKPGGWLARLFLRLGKDLKAPFLSSNSGPTSVERLELGPFNLDRFVTRGTHLNDPAAVRMVSIQPSGHLQSFTYFLSQFPNLETLVVTSPKILRGEEGDDLYEIKCRPIALKLTSYQRGQVEYFFSCLTWTTIRCRSIRLGGVVMDDFTSLRNFFRMCANSLESVKFISYTIGECQVSTPSISC